MVGYKALNTTIVKHNFSHNSFNRTFMELKYRNAHISHPGDQGFNRTFMELK